MFKKLSNESKITSTHEIFHIISTKWIENWESYVDLN